MDWTDNTVLLEYSKYTPCKDIFQAVCNELGKHYVAKGFKYARSRPKLSIEDDTIKLEINFWSSGYNTPGDYVLLEILPHFYAKQLKKTSVIDGYLFGHTGLFYHKYKDDPTQIRVNQIFGDVLDRIDEDSDESSMIDSHTCNVYGLDKEKFDHIVRFIDTKIVYWLSKIQTAEGVRELLANASTEKIWALNGKGTNSDFVKYVQLNFPDIDVEKELGL